MTRGPERSVEFYLHLNRTTRRLRITTGDATLSKDDPTLFPPIAMRSVDDVYASQDQPSQRVHSPDRLDGRAIAERLNKEGRSNKEERSHEEIQVAIDAAASELQDALQRLTLAKGDSAGAVPQLDLVEAFMLPGSSPEAARKRRAASILQSVAQSLRLTAERLDAATDDTTAE